MLSSVRTGLLLIVKATKERYSALFSRRSAMNACCLLAFFVIVFLKYVFSHADTNGNGFAFLGDNYWTGQARTQCDQPNNNYYKNPDLYCVTFLRPDFEVIRIEIINRQPLLLVFRKFANQSLIDNFLGYVDKKTLVQQTVLDKEGPRERASRVANGSWLQHKESLETAALFRRTQDVIPHVDWGKAELWSVLSYLPGGHYAPHYDYLLYKDKSEWDWWMNAYGNRAATFLLVLKTADLGGATVFPKIDTTVIPEAGDVIFWTNQNTAGEVDNYSFHGACVIMEGRKIAATLWIRQKDQILVAEGIGKDAFPVEPLIDPHNFKPTCPFSQ